VKEKEEPNKQEQKTPLEVTLEKQEAFEEMINGGVWTALETEEILLRVPSFLQFYFLHLLAIRTLQEAMGEQWEISASGHLPLWQDLLDASLGHLRSLIQEERWLQDGNPSSPSSPSSALSLQLPFREVHLEFLPLEIQIAAWLLLPQPPRMARKILLMRQTLIRTRAFRLGEYPDFSVLRGDLDFWAHKRKHPIYRQEEALHLHLWQETLTAHHIQKARRYFVILAHAASQNVSSVESPPAQKEEPTKDEQIHSSLLVDFIEPMDSNVESCKQGDC